MVSLYLLDTCKINGAHFDPEVVRMLQVARDTAPKNLNSVWVTSANDGEHKNGSLHYRNRAFDLRVWGLTDDERARWAERMQRALGDDYDVVDEETHVHCEYDPEP
jgi:hypothetical protein